MGSHSFLSDDLNHSNHIYFQSTQQNFFPSQIPSIRSKEHLYNLICISILPHTYTNLEPLSIGNMGSIFLTCEDYKSLKFEEQDRITLEMCLSIASECRRKLFLIANFSQHHISKDYSVKPQLIQHQCIKPIRDVLQNFLEEITESVQKKRSTFKDPWELLNFLTNYIKQIDPIFSTFQSLLSTSSALTLNDILNFWRSFLREMINLWDYNKLLKWQEDLFEGFVNLLGKCTLEEINSISTIDFLNFFSEPDHYISNSLVFLRRCLELMPKYLKESLPLFDGIFTNFWENAKESKCVRYTSTFLLFIIRQSLDKFSTEINFIVLAELSHTILCSHLQHIKKFYSFNTNSIDNLLNNSTFIPPFENISTDSNKLNKCTDWNIIENELRKRLGCSTEDYINDFYKIQHWTISIFLTPNIYKLLDCIFLHLYKIIHAWHKIINFSNNLEINSRTKRNINFASIDIKAQIRRRLALKIIRFLQIIIQSILGQFNSINAYYIKKLLDQVDSSETLLQRLIEISNEWNESLDSLNYFINNTLLEPLNEAIRLVDEFIETTPEFTKITDQMESDEKVDEYDDYEVKKYLSLQTRLQRVYLFTSNVELEKKKGKIEQILSINEGPPQIKDSLVLIKMMLAT